MRAGSALPRVHSMLSVLGARELLQGLAYGNVAGPQSIEGTISASQAVLCNLLCLCRRAQISAAAVSACPSVLMTLLWILLSFYRCVLLDAIKESRHAACFLCILSCSLLATHDLL